MRSKTTPPWRAPLLVAAGITAVFLTLAVLHPGREQRVLRHVLTWTSVAVLISLFLWGWKAASAAPPPRARRWTVGGLALIVAALFVPAFQSSDLYAYAQTGWLQVHYDVNPYTTVPVDVTWPSDDPMFTTTWQEVPCVYGFGFALLSRGPARWSGGDIDAARMWFRMLSALTLLAIAWLLSRLLAREGRRVEPTLYLLLWSPFVLLHFVSNGHNDLLLGLLVLIALAAARTGHGIAVLPALCLAALIKVVAVVALPFAVVFLWRRRGPATFGWSLLAGAGVTALISLPYVQDLSAFRFDAIWLEWTRPAHSLTAAVVHALATLDAGMASGVETVVRIVLLVGFGAFVLWRLTRAIWGPAYDAEVLIRDTAWVLFILIVLVSAKFHPWYLGMILPTALLLPEGHPLRRLTLWLTVTWMLVFTGVGKARILDFLLMTALPVAVFLVREHRQSADRSAV